MKLNSNYFVLYYYFLILDRNEIYLIGKFNNIEYPKATKLNTSALKDSIYSLYVSREDEIFLICSSGDVYKSTNEGEIHFERIILFNDNDVITKFCSGNGFVCVLTGTINHFHRLIIIELI